MFSPDELNMVMRLKYPKQKIVDWMPIHLDMITLNDFDTEHLDMYKKNLNRQTMPGYRFTAMERDTIYACFGLWELWPGVAECWLIPNTNIGKRVFRFHKACLLFFEHAANKRDIKRLQITVRSRNDLAVHWAERCYFNKEGLMRKWGPEYDDYWIMSRLFE